MASKRLQEILIRWPLEAYPADQQQRIREGKSRYQALVTKWQHKIVPGWYGFDLYDVPLRWLNIIDDFLDYLHQEDPNFKIHQIKLKFGSLRFYVECQARLRQEIAELENHLVDQGLVF